MIVIRADANSKIGMGHVMRCTAIADRLREKGEQVCFLVADENPVPLLQGKGIPCHVLHTDYSHMEEETRKQSFHTEPIPWETHVEWLKGVLQNKDRHLYICLHGDTPVGMYRLDRISEETFEISYSIAQACRERGYGRAMLKEGEAFFLAAHPDVKKLTARVKDKNAASCRLFEELGYEKIQEEGFCCYRKQED